MINLLVALPCFNEAENIDSLVENWILEQETLEEINIKLNILIINDKSTDNTEEIGRKLEGNHDFVKLVSHKVNKGLSGGLNTAIEYFSENFNSTDLLCIMDGDNTQQPKYIQSMIDKLNEGYDCIIASRYCKTSDIVGVKKYRVFLSDMARLYYKLFLKVPNVEDYTCGYRLYRYDTIKKVFSDYGVNPIKEKSFACMMELLYKVYLVGGTFNEVPFQLRYDNKKGQSKMNVLQTAFKSLTTAIRLRYKKEKF